MSIIVHTSVWDGLALSSMGKYLASELWPLAEGVFQQEYAVWEVAVLSLQNDRLEPATSSLENWCCLSINNLCGRCEQSCT